MVKKEEGTLEFSLLLLLFFFFKTFNNIDKGRGEASLCGFRLIEAACEVICRELSQLFWPGV